MSDEVIMIILKTAKLTYASLVQFNLIQEVISHNGDRCLASTVHQGLKRMHTHTVKPRITASACATSKSARLGSVTPDKLWQRTNKEGKLFKMYASRLLVAVLKGLQAASFVQRQVLPRLV